MAAGRLPRCFREIKKHFYIYERYRFNRNTIVYITDLLHKDLCPLTGGSQSIDAVTKVLLTLRYFVHYRL